MSDTNTTDRPGDEAPADQPAAGENICPECSGNGEIDGQTCQNCQGEGYVTEGVGGA